MSRFYFSVFEDRKPPEPIPYSASRELLWQFFAILNVCLGGWYLWWRWNGSLNYDALWFAVPLVVAESFAYVGLLLFTFNLWAVRDFEQTPPPKAHEILHRPEGLAGDSLPTTVAVDVFFPTFDEDPELVRLSVLDAKKITYPHPIDIRIHVLDDGRRDAMKAVAEAEGVNYIRRENNIGFKAGNLQNAIHRTSADFILICDADTRPFPTILEHTLGYFRDPTVAWVQTPQWFFDLPEGKPLPDVLNRYLGIPGRWAGKAFEALFGPVRLGEDPFNNDPRMFYDVIQRRRNWANASFCCGAGSVHRRDAVLFTAYRTRISMPLQAWSLEESGPLHSFEKAKDELAERFEIAERKAVKAAFKIPDKDYRNRFLRTMQDICQESRKKVIEDIDQSIRQIELFLAENPIPYKHHVSEDMYTSLLLHSETAIISHLGFKEEKWKSVLHPHVESKMLSPQDLLSWTIQRFKYAGGTIDIALREKHLLFQKGLSLSQKLMYGATFWSYLACVWNIVFLLAPVIYLFTGVPPVEVYSVEFFKHFFPFIVANTLAMMVGTWGIPSWSGQSTYLSFFWVNFHALWTVLKRERRTLPRILTDQPGCCRVNGKAYDMFIKDMSHFNFFASGALQVKLPKAKDADIRVGDEIELEFCGYKPEPKRLTETGLVVRVRRVETGMEKGMELGVQLHKRHEQKIKFRVTPKIRQQKSFARLVLPQMVVIGLTVAGFTYGGVMYHLGLRDDAVALIANLFWGGFNIIALSGLVRAAFWQPEDDTAPEI